MGVSGSGMSGDSGSDSVGDSVVGSFCINIEHNRRPTDVRSLNRPCFAFFTIIIDIPKSIKFSKRKFFSRCYNCFYKFESYSEHA